MTTEAELRALLAEAKTMLMFPLDYSSYERKALDARITAALAEKDGGGKLTEIPYVMTIKWDHGETVHRGVMPLPPLPERKV